MLPIISRGHINHNGDCLLAMNHSLFENCSDHYTNEYLYENCSKTSAPCKLIKDLNTAQSVFFYEYYVTISLFSVAALANFYCLCVTLPLFFQFGEESRKRYIFLVTRCISCILAVISMVLTTSVFEDLLTPNASNFYLYAVVNIISSTSTFGLLGSFVGLTVLFYVGVVHPVFMRTEVTLRFIYFLVFTIYVISLAVSIPFGIFQAAIQNPGVIYCDRRKCVPWVNLVQFVIVAVCLVFTIAILVFVLISLIRNNRKLKRVRSDTLSSSASSMKRIRRRLAWTIFAVTLISAAEIIRFVFLIDAVYREQAACEKFYRANKLAEEALAGFTESLVWCFIFLFDPLANIFYDKNVFERVKQQFKWLRQKLPSSSLPSTPFLR